MSSNNPPVNKVVHKPAAIRTAASSQIGAEGQPPMAFAPNPTAMATMQMPSPVIGARCSGVSFGGGGLIASGRLGFERHASVAVVRDGFEDETRSLGHAVRPLNAVLTVFSPHHCRPIFPAIKALVAAEWPDIGSGSSTWPLSV
jgi:hypothetical protein